MKPLSLAGHGWHSGVEIKGKGREGKFALFSLFLPPLFSAFHASDRLLMTTEFLTQ